MEILEQLAKAVEFGKINQKVPASIMKGELGADELSTMALEQGIAPEVILSQ